MAHIERRLLKVGSLLDATAKRADTLPAAMLK